MADTAFDYAAIAADAVTLAELDGGTGRERVRIDWLLRRLHDAPGRRRVDDVGNLVWTFGPPPYRLAVLVHVDDVFGEATARGITERDGWLSGPGIGDNAIAVATAVAVAEHGQAVRRGAERPDQVARVVDAPAAGRVVQPAQQPVDAHPFPAGAAIQLGQRHGVRGDRRRVEGRVGHVTWPAGTGPYRADPGTAY